MVTMSRLIPTFLCSAVLLLASACGGQENQIEDRIVKVNVLTVSDGTTGGFHEYVGTLEEAAASTLSFGVGGRVTAVYVKDGQHVVAGQLLASVDKSSATNAFNAAKATLNRAQDGYDRARQVYEKGSLPEVKMIEVQTQLDQAQSMYDMARKSLDDCNLYAPTSGTIDGRMIEKGSSVTAFQPVMRLLDLSSLYVKMSVPEVDISSVRVGDSVRVLVSAVADSNGPTFRGMVEERRVSADAMSHSYLVRIRMQANQRGLLPGMVCRVRLADRQVRHGVEVPSRAVQLMDKGARYVWVVNDGTAHRRHVKIGDLTRTGVLVTEGLNEGDCVMIDGMMKVSEGTKVSY